MAALIPTQRYNWMGYNGTESREIETLFLRGTDGNAVSDYWHRQSVIEDIKKRLFIIKGDLDLIPEDEIRAEREAARRRRQVREAEELERKMKEEEARSLEYQRTLEQEKVGRSAGLDFEERRKKLQQSNIGVTEEEANNLLEEMPRTKMEVDEAADFITNGVRGFLVNNGAYYVSYLDGSGHTSLEKLEEYNKKNFKLTERSLEDTHVNVPPADKYSTTELVNGLERLEIAQKKLQAYLCGKDPTFVMRLRKADKDKQGNPIVHITEEDGDEETLRQNINDAKANLVLLREAYNKRAMVCGHRLANAAINGKIHYDPSE